MNNIIDHTIDSIKAKTHWLKEVNILNRALLNRSLFREKYHVK